MARRDETPRDLLFGLLALQVGLIDQDQLVGAFSAWSRARGRGLAEILVGRGAIDAESRALLEGMAAKHLEIHGGETERSLASVGVGHSTRERLAALGDTDLTGSVTAVGSHTPSQDATATMSVGTSTSQGQRFRVLRPHAQGGLGAVFVALDGELNREVALKQILDHHADNPASRARFLIEAEITGGLEHPGIVPVYGLGHHVDGRPYYAMRFIRGDSLKDALAAFHADESLKGDPGRRSLALRKLLRRFVDVCNAVGYAHGRGVLHRDLKPGNVIVGRHGETLVVDWGLAKPMGKAEPSTTSDERTLMPSSSGSAETLPGSAVGTPAYMSPEQACGDLDRLGPRSDVYSLGATLYCLLTGRAPFEGADLGTILRDVQRGAFAPPREVDPSVDRALQAICLKAMAARPEDRHASARALAEDVERWAADEPVSAWREPFSARARRRMRRHRTAVTAASAAVLVALVGLAGVLAVQSRANARLEAKNLELDRANRLKDEANVGLRQANARVKARFELAREAIRSFQDGVSEDDMLRGEELRGLRDKLLRSAAGFYEKLERLLQGHADRVSRAMLAQSYFELGELTEQIGIQPEALAVHRKALAIRRELAGSPEADAAARLDLARSLNATGHLAEATGDHAGALSSYEEARGLVEPMATGPGATTEARDLLGAGHQWIGWVLHRTGKKAEALESYRRALEIQGGLAEENPAVTGFRSRLAESHNKLGVLQSQTGQMAEALESYRRALEIRAGVAGENPAVTEFRSRLAASHHNLGMLQDQAGRSAEALESYRRALAIHAKLARDHPAVTDFRRSLATTHGNIGWLLSQNGQLAEALASYREAAAILGKLAQENPGVVGFRETLALTLHNIGWMLDQHGPPAQAMAAYGEALTIRRKLARDSPGVTEIRSDLARTLGNIGFLELRTGRPAEGMESYREALAIEVELAGEHPDVTDYQSRLASTYLRIGFFHLSSGRPAEAVEDFAREAAIREELARDNPSVPNYRNDLANCLTNSATLLLRIDRPSEARASCERAVGLREPLVRDHPGTTQYREELAETYLRFGQVRVAEGDPAGAGADWKRAVALFRSVPELTTEYLFYHGCAHAWLAMLAAKAGNDPSLGRGEDEAAEAMALLGRAAAMGYRNPSTYRTETALDPLRGRPDFRLLMMDLTFPARPFAR